MHLLSLLPLILFPLTVSAGWVRMWTTSAQVGRKHPVHFTQPSWQDNICFGPIGGSPPFHIEAINFRPGTMAMFTDECREQNLIDCDDCTGLVVNWNTSVVHHDEIWGIFKLSKTGGGAHNDGIPVSPDHGHA